MDQREGFIKGLVPIKCRTGRKYPKGVDYLSQVLMSYHKVKADLVVNCPKQGGNREIIQACQGCSRNKGFVENKDYKWARCKPLE